MQIDKETLASVSRKIKALLQRTQEAGCTEAEAAAAAGKAHELLAKYQLSLSELDLKEEGTCQTKVKVSGLEIERNLMGAVAGYCDCKVWRHRESRGDIGTVVFLGLKSDAFFAECLLASLTGFVQRETLLFSLDQETRGVRHLVDSFKHGACQRIKERLNEAVAARRTVPAQDNSRALVVAKAAMVAEAFEALGIKLRKPSKAATVTVDARAFGAGRDSGDKARFSRPVARDFAEQRQLTAATMAK